MISLHIVFIIFAFILAHINYFLVIVVIANVILSIIFYAKQFRDNVYNLVVNMQISDLQYLEDNVIGTYELLMHFANFGFSCHLKMFLLMYDLER